MDDSRIRGAGGDPGDMPGASVTSGRAMQGALDTFEDNWWRDNYAELEELQRDRGYEYYRPAFRYGWEAYGQHRGRSWTEAEQDLSTGWNARRGESDAKWDEAKRAVRHAFERAGKAFR